MTITAVIFDLGGVVIASPMQTFAAHEREQGLEHNFINRMIVANGSESAWGRLERGEIAMDAEFFALFDAELATAGAPGLCSQQIFADVAATAGVNDNMVAAIGLLRDAGYKLAALTNNWVDAKDPGVAHSLQSLFDAFVESAVEGVRKPDPRIYQIVCERLEIEPGAAIFLDDIGQNLKSARALGMTTIKVVEPLQAIVELEQILGLELQS
ncbi:MAG: HAD family phosphatase [Gammaproteobacteria bacterium]|nr:HAD family phosphatase [Gammaproteobacteria bacterium]